MNDGYHDAREDVMPAQTHHAQPQLRACVVTGLGQRHGAVRVVGAQLNLNGIIPRSIRSSALCG
jgi:hypothetical protein